MLTYSSQNLSADLLSLAILTFFEIVLGIDNLVFLSIVTNRLPVAQQKSARRLGLSLALITRVMFLGFLFIIVKMVHPLFSVFNFAVSGRDLLMIAGGLFLLYKSTKEIHMDMQPNEITQTKKKQYNKFALVIGQIILLDIIFSFDSLFTAIGMTKNFWVIVMAIWLSILAMMFAAEPLSRFIHERPTIKMLALSFLLMIGTMLIADGFHFEVPKGYIYFSICFSLLVETLNQVAQKRNVARMQRSPNTGSL